jgi:hypothetical protein
MLNSFSDWEITFSCKFSRQRGGAHYAHECALCRPNDGIRIWWGFNLIHIRCVIDVLWGTDILFTFITVSESTDLYLDDYNQRPTWACITQIVTNDHAYV